MFMSDKYDKFIREYNSQHTSCPKCGSVEHSTTLMGYIPDLNNLKDFKDRNLCTCIKCGDKHYTHDRVSKADIRDGKIDRLLDEI